MHSLFWLDDVFRSRSRVRILRLLVRDPGKNWTEREIARFLGMSTSSINAAIRALVGEGALELRVIGRTHAVRLRRQSATARLLGRVFQAESEALPEVERIVRAATPSGVACYLFGSAGRGVADPDSDVDLFVAARNQQEADEAAARIREELAKEFPTPIEFIVLGGVELRRRRKSPLVQSVRREGRPLSSVTLEDLL